MPEQDEGAFKIPSVALVFFYALKDGSFLIVSWCFFKVFSLDEFLWKSLLWLVIFLTVCVGYVFWLSVILKEIYAY